MTTRRGLGEVVVMWLVSPGAFQMTGTAEKSPQTVQLVSYE